MGMGRRRDNTQKPWRAGIPLPVPMASAIWEKAPLPEIFAVKSGLPGNRAMNQKKQKKKKVNWLAVSIQPKRAARIGIPAALWASAIHAYQPNRLQSSI